MKPLEPREITKIFNNFQLYENMDTLANKLNEVIDKLNEMENKKND